MDARLQESFPFRQVSSDHFLVVAVNNLCVSATPNFLALGGVSIDAS